MNAPLSDALVFFGATGDLASSIRFRHMGRRRSGPILSPKRSAWCSTGFVKATDLLNARGRRLDQAGHGFEPGFSDNLRKPFSSGSPTALLFHRHGAAWLQVLSLLQQHHQIRLVLV